MKKEDTESLIALGVAGVAGYLLYRYLLPKPAVPEEAHPMATTGQQHVAVRTPLIGQVARAILEKTFTNYIMRPPKPHETAMLLAHSALETGRWKRMYCNNWGFVTTQGGLDWFHVAGNSLKFRYYRTPEAGCEDFMRVLMRDWPDAWAVIDGDDPHLYVQKLGHGKYGSYYGDPKTVGPSYDRGVSAFYQEFRNWTDTPDPPLPGT